MSENKSFCYTDDVEILHFSKKNDTETVGGGFSVLRFFESACSLRDRQLVDGVIVEIYVFFFFF